jgi:hypothetical protein
MIKVRINHLRWFYNDKCLEIKENIQVYVDMDLKQLARFTMEEYTAGHSEFFIQVLDSIKFIVFRYAG